MARVVDLLVIGQTETVLLSKDPAERYQLVFLLHGQPADDREFYDLIVRMTDDADLGGFGAHEAQQDFRRVRRALDALVAGRDPAFDDRGYFTGDARGRARFRARRPPNPLLRRFRRRLLLRRRLGLGS